jgi:hypothetical protein
MKASHPAVRWVRAGLSCAALMLVVTAHAAELSFIEGLSPTERTSVGTSRLSASQVAVLDALVAQDVTIAHQGGVTGFSTAFSARHWERERDASGIDRLSTAELAALDTLAARAIATGPSPDEAFAYTPPKVLPPPAPVKESVVSTVKKAEVHGDVSLTVGAGSHGSSFYGTGMDVSVTDPTGHFTVAVGFDTFHGKGLLGLCGPDGIYGPPYGVGPYLGPYLGP